MPYQSLRQLTENQRYYAYLSMLRNVKREVLIGLFNVIDYDKDGFLSVRDLIITLEEEVFNAFIDGF